MLTISDGSCFLFLLSSCKEQIFSTARVSLFVNSHDLTCYRLIERIHRDENISVEFFSIFLMDNTTPNVNDVWASLREGENDRLSEYRKRAAALKSKSKISVVDLIKKTEKKEREREKVTLSGGASDQQLPREKKKNVISSCSSQAADHTSKIIIADNDGRKELKREKHDDISTESTVVVVKKVTNRADTESFNQATTPNNEKSKKPEAVLIKANEMTSQIARDLNCANKDDMNDRRRALLKIQKTLFTDFTMSTGDYNEVFRESCKPIFRRFSDVSEKCRESSLKITQSFFELSSDLVPILAYFFPMLMQRLPSGLAYDEEMKVFITNMEMHESYRRGKAVDRQDKIGGAVGELVHHVIEESEEIRYLLCKVLGTLIRRTMFLNASSILHPYFHEIIMYLQMQVRDPFPELKAEACSVLELLARTEEFNSGMKFFAVALVRVTLPALRHRHAKVSNLRIFLFTFIFYYRIRIFSYKILSYLLFFAHFNYYCIM